MPSAYQNPSRPVRDPPRKTDLCLVTIQNWRAAVILPHEYAHMLDECQRRSHKVVGAPRYLTMGLLASFPVVYGHQTDAFIGIVYAPRDLDELLGIHAKDDERKRSMVGAV
jgi:hypothetical protein